MTDLKAIRRLLRLKDLKVKDLEVKDLEVRDLKVKDLKVKDLKVKDLKVVDAIFSGPTTCRGIRIPALAVRAVPATAAD
jgi:hypothetical protein